MSPRLFFWKKQSKPSKRSALDSRSLAQDRVAVQLKRRRLELWERMQEAIRRVPDALALHVEISDHLRTSKLTFDRLIASTGSADEIVTFAGRILSLERAAEKTLAAVKLLQQQIRDRAAKLRSFEDENASMLAHEIQASDTAGRAAS